MRIGWALAPMVVLLAACSVKLDVTVGAQRAEVPARAAAAEFGSTTAPDLCHDQYWILAAVNEAFWATHGYGPTDLEELPLESVGIPSGWALVDGAIVGTENGPCPGYDGSG
jgi:hypothetical protein